MKYQVRVGGREFEIEIDGERVRVGDQGLVARLTAIPGGPLVRMAIDGTSKTYAISHTRDGWEIQHRGRRWLVEVTDERSRSLRQLVGQARRRPEGGMVRAPMPGMVLRVEVESGQKVASGSGLLVLEAMKMENEIRAGSAGVIKQIFVRPGQAVEKGADLLEITIAQG